MSSGVLVYNLCVTFFLIAYAISVDSSDSLKRAVPAGHSFKGFPAQYSCVCARIIAASLLKQALPLDILASRGDNVRFALRVRVFPYPEGMASVWVMLAVRFHAASGDRGARTAQARSNSSAASGGGYGVPPF